MTTIRLYHKCEELFGNAKIAEVIFRFLCDGIEECEDAVPERKKGKWVLLSSTYNRTPCEMRFCCSECYHETIVHASGTSYPWEHYCPNCGAEMVKG